MKHPKLSILQDYFENELNSVQSDILKNHLMDCNQCTLILSQMANVDVRFKMNTQEPVSSETKNKIYASAKVMLEMKRKKITDAQYKGKQFEEWRVNMRDLILNSFKELKVPAFQLASLTMLLGYIVSVNQTLKITKEKPLSEELVVYFHDDNDLPNEGEINETNLDGNFDDNKDLGGIPTEGDFVLPFSKQGYPLKEFIKDYAEIIKVNISYSSSLLSKREEPLNIYIHDKTSFANYTTLFKSILDSRGYTLIEENGFKWLSPVRDVRFLPIHFYNNQTIPNDESFVTTIIRLKYPVASEITNRVRTFMSRYGRTVGFSDGRSIILTDKGETILKMIETIKFMDTEEVYKAALDKKPKEAKPEDNELNKKIVELELKNKILENKITDKEEKGGADESITSDSNSSN